jgi:predicted nucleic acid-binding protein
LTFLLDTSVLVAALTSEAASSRCRSFMSERQGELAISAWVISEFSAALAMKQRLGFISREHRLATLRLFDDLLYVPVAVFDVLSVDFTEAASLCDDHELALRAPDALHLAVAARTRGILVTLDLKLSRIAATLGHQVETP